MIGEIGRTATWNINTQTDSTQSQRNSQSTSSGGFSRDTDTVDISPEALALQGSPRDEHLVETIDSQGYLTTSTQGKMAGSAGVGLKKYLGLNGSYADTSLAAMNMSRKAIGARIDGILKAKGIKLGKDEKITISVDAKNNIVVGGLKDRGKADSIAKALQADPILAKDMLRHVATGKINDAARKQSAYEKQMGDLGVDTAGLAEAKGAAVESQFTDKGLRTWLVDQYLMDNVGMGIAELQHERDADGNVSIIGMNDELRRLFDEDPELAATVGNMLENGETISDFKVSFEFANGTISDSTTVDAAKDKIEGIKAYIMGGVDDNGNIVPGMIDNLCESLMGQGVGDDEEYKAIMAFVSKGFSIRAGADGKYEIVGAENLTKEQVSMLKNVVDKALEAWAKAGNPFDDPAYYAPTDNRTASLADVADSFVEQHRFEHADVDEFKHMVEINFSASGDNMVKVVSPDADKAQDNKNRETADALGKELKSYLEDSGVELGGGLEVEVDEDGKFTVLGDANDPNVKKAQQLLDQFANEGKVVGGTPETEVGKKDGKQAAASRAAARSDTGSYEKYNRSKLVSEAMEELGVPDENAPYGEYRKLNLYIGWKTLMAEGLGGPVNNSNVGPVSAIKAPRYANDSGDTVAGAIGSRTLALNDDRYAGDATGLYRKLLDGMGQFHDDRKNVKYRFTIA